MRPKVYVTRLLTREAMDRIYSFCDARVWEGELPPLRRVLLENVKDIEGLLSLLTDRVDAQLMDQAPKLKVISNCAVGFDNIDVKEATKRGLVVGNTPGVLTDTTADFAFALLMAAARRVVEGDRAVRAGKWKTWGPMILLGQDVHGATLGIIGLGRIGSTVARRAKGFGMKTLYTDVYRNKQAEDELGIQYVDMDTLLAQSDFITVHTNLTPETHHMIGSKQFEKMKRTAILVNTSPDQALRRFRPRERCGSRPDIGRNLPGYQNRPRGRSPFPLLEYPGSGNDERKEADRATHFRSRRGRGRRGPSAFHEPL